MPKGIGRPEAGPVKKRQQALHATIADIAKSGDANMGDIDKKLREQNVRMMDLSMQTRQVMANAGPGAHRRRAMQTKSMLSQRKPGGSD